MFFFITSILPGVSLKAANPSSSLHIPAPSKLPMVTSKIFFPWFVAIKQQGFSGVENGVEFVITDAGVFRRKAYGLCERFFSDGRVEFCNVKANKMMVF